jgi:membrane protease YdiL (CAAX protease family)
MKTSSIQSFIKKHAFIVYVFLAVLISWSPWFISGSGFFVFGPSIAGVIIIALTRGKAGMRELGQRALRWRVGFTWWGVALLFTGLIILVSIPINLALGGNLPSFAFFRQEWYLAPVFFALTLLGGPLGEEFGWRGFALPNLQAKYGAVATSLIIGVVWALWHLPLFFQPGSLHAQIGLSRLPLFILGEIVLATIMTWVYNNTSSSLLVGGIILHNADNFWASTLITDETMTTAFRGVVQSQFNMQLYIVSTFVGVLVILALILVTKGKLGLSKPETRETKQEEMTAR